MEDESGNLTVLSSECVEICMRLLAADMFLQPHIGLSGKEIYIKIGAPYEILADEAQVLGMRVRLRETKGSVIFRAEYAEYYAPNRFDKNDTIALDGTERGHDKCTPFTSGMRQILVDSRMRRVAGLDLETRQFMPDAEDAIERMKEAIDDHEQIRAHQLMELLTCCGGFRPYVEQVLGAAVRLLAQQCLTDPYFVVFPDERELDADEKIMQEAQERHMTMKGIEPVTWKELVQVLALCVPYPVFSPQ